MDMAVENVDMMRQKWTLIWDYGEKWDSVVVNVDMNVGELDGDGEKLDTDSILYAIAYSPSVRAALDDETPQPPTHFLPLIAVVTGYVPITQGMMYNVLVRARVYDY